MENYRTGAHTRFDIKYHFVWVTKYRKGVLTGEVGVRLRDLVRQQEGTELGDGGGNFSNNQIVSEGLQSVAHETFQPTGFSR